MQYESSDAQNSIQVQTNEKPGTNDDKASQSRLQTLISWVIVAVLICSASAYCVQIWGRLGKTSVEKSAGIERKEDADSVQLAAGANPLNSIKLIHVTTEVPNRSIVSTGSIEANHKRIQQVTPLVTGRVREVLVSTGQLVKKGDLLVVLDSPQVAELHGKLHEAQSKVQLAKSEL